MVLDDDPVEPGRRIAHSVGDCAIIDRAYWLAVIIWRAWQGRGVHHANDRAPFAEQRFERVSTGLGDLFFWHPGTRLTAVIEGNVAPSCLPRPGPSRDDCRLTFRRCEAGSHCAQ